MAHTEFSEEVLADNPIGYWRFSEPMGSINAIDLSENGLNGHYSTSGLLLGHMGVGGGDRGVLFEGLGNGRVSVPDDALLNPANITIEALVSWSGSNGFQQRIVEKSSSLSGTEAGYGLSILDDGRVRVELKTGGGVSFVTSQTSLVPLYASHVVGTYDGSTISIYINGILDTRESAQFPGSIQSTPNDLGIGNQVERDRPFKGLIDEAVLYDLALSEARIAAHFAAAAVISEPIPLSIDSDGLTGDGLTGDGLTGDGLTGDGLTGDGVYPVHAFLPLPVGLGNSPSIYRQGIQIPAQFETAATWPNGSPKVLHARFNANFTNGVFASHEVRFESHQLAYPPFVMDDGTTITVNTGPLTFSVQRPFAGFSSIQYNGQTVGGGSGGPSCLDGRKIEWASQYDDEGTLIIERQGPTCVTLKAEGWLQNPERRVSPFLRYCTRIYAYDGLAYIRIHHAVTFAGRMSDRCIENLRFDIPIAISEPGQWAYGADGEVYEGELAEGSALYIHQERHDAFRRFNRVNPGRKDTPDASGQQAEGWFARRNGATQIGLLVKDFWEKFPNEVEITANKIALHTWPRHGHHHYTDEALYRYEHLHKFRWLHEGAILNTKLPPKAYEVLLDHPETSEARPQHALAQDAQGVSLTTELGLIFSDPHPSSEPTSWAEQHRQWLDLFTRNPIALPPASYVAASGIFGEHFAEVGNDFPQIERAIERMALGAIQPNRWEDFGKFIYGDMHHGE
ncbi:MAG: LamG domain-containing protein, partial [Leptolyngbya sp. SIO1D8]|nr:LamG domain-containing protein [Leptolyngbya sp. SIO1D8]